MNALQELSEHTSDMLDHVAAFGDYFRAAVVSLLPEHAVTCIESELKRDVHCRNDSTLLRLIGNEAEETFLALLSDICFKNEYVLGRAKVCAGDVLDCLGRSAGNVIEFRKRA